MTAQPDMFRNQFAREYVGRVMRKRPTLADVQGALRDYPPMLMSIMHIIAERSEGAFGGRLIDTKFSTLTGSSYSSEDPIRGPGIVYGYIQGRGLEALVEHCQWIAKSEPHPKALQLKARLESIMESVLTTLRDFRQLNGGHLFFFMDPEGRPSRITANFTLEPVRLTADSEFTKTDLFCSKGMYLASKYLGNDAAAEESLEYCHKVYNALWDGNLMSDQQPLDPKNVSHDIPGRISHSPFMLLLDMADILLRAEPSEANIQFGLRLIDRVVNHHTYRSSSAGEFEPYDFWEFVTEDGSPYRIGERVPSDPGHALEFVGLALRFVYHVQDTSPNGSTVNSPNYTTDLARVMTRNFANGFNSQRGGIIKSFDLKTRRPLNSDMPWWNLPETMRAAAYCWKMSDDPEVRRVSLEILSACHNAFNQGYVRPNIGLFAVQTRSSIGEDLDVIPATSDADPGYHTGISIIDTLQVFGLASD